MNASRRLPRISAARQCNAKTIVMSVPPMTAPLNIPTHIVNVGLGERAYDIVIGRGVLLARRAHRRVAARRAHRDRHRRSVANIGCEPDRGFAARRRRADVADRRRRRRGHQELRGLE